MDAISEMFNRAVEQLLGRSSGPLHFRLIMQPIVATILAIRAGLRDARAGSPPFFWAYLTTPTARKILAQSGWKDISKLFIVAMVLDGIFQVIALRAFFVVQAVIVATAVAVIPYVLIRGPVTRLASSLSKQAERVKTKAVKAG